MTETATYKFQRDVSLKYQCESAMSPKSYSCSSAELIKRLKLASLARKICTLYIFSSLVYPLLLMDNILLHYVQLVTGTLWRG